MPVPAPYWPGEHTTHDAAPAVVRPVAPYWPLGHAVPLQVLVDEKLANMPDTHDVHADNFADAWPTRPNFPGGQLVPAHVTWPADVVYFPGEQALHETPNALI